LLLILAAVSLFAAAFFFFSLFAAACSSSSVSALVLVCWRSRVAPAVRGFCMSPDAAAFFVLILDPPQTWR
jgi:hypothetical protein